MFMPCGCWGRGKCFLSWTVGGNWITCLYPKLPTHGHLTPFWPLLSTSVPGDIATCPHAQVNIWRGNFGDIKAFLEIRAWKGTWDSCVGAAEDRQGFLEMAACISQYRPRD